MRRRMLPVLMAVVVAASLYVAEPGYAAEPTATPGNAATKPQTPAAPATAPAAPASPSEADAQESSPEPAEGAKEASSKRPSPQRFTPSEQVRADFDVSFPIDI